MTPEDRAAAEAALIVAEAADIGVEHLAAEHVAAIRELDRLRIRVRTLEAAARLARHALTDRGDTRTAVDTLELALDLGR